MINFIVLSVFLQDECLVSCAIHFTLCSRVDWTSKLWICPFCLTRNQLPPQYAEATQQNYPKELLPNSATVEYAMNRPSAGPPVYFFCIDTSMPVEELESLKYGVRSLRIVINVS